MFVNSPDGFTNEYNERLTQFILSDGQKIFRPSDSRDRRECQEPQSS